jgi:hypothetical protein
MATTVAHGHTTQDERLPKLYCQHCGNPLAEDDHVDTPEEAAEKVARADAHASVEIAKIQKERDIALAKIASGAIDQEQSVEVAVAEAEAEIATDALEAATAPEDPEPSTVIVNSDPAPEPEPEAAPLPEPESSPESESEPKTERHGYGSPAWFGH